MERFLSTNTQVLGVSVDSVHSHAAWAASLGGVSFPLLADFHPKGGLASAYGLYLDTAGISDRATVLIDTGGIVQYAKSVGPAGQRNISELLVQCEELASEDIGFTSPQGIPSGSTLYVRDNCGASRSALWARENLRLQTTLPIKNVSQDSAAAAELEKASGGGQAPCLIVNGKSMLESGDIVDYLVEKSGRPVG